MRLLALLTALLLDRHAPSVWRLRTRAALARMLDSAAAGVPALPPWGAWVLLLASSALVAALIDAALAWIGAVFAWLYRAVLLYLLLDFSAALEPLRRAREAMRHGDASLVASAADGGASSTSAALERGLRAAHQGGFALALWFVLFGVSGALGYWVSCRLAQREWRTSAGQDTAQRGFRALDWLPARASAASFAMVGDFEDALYCARAQASSDAPDSRRVVAAAAGALGVRVSTAAGELGTGEPADADALQSAEGLIMRAAILWLAVMLLISLTLWFGSGSA